MSSLDDALWPLERLAEGLARLAHASGLAAPVRSETARLGPPPARTAADPALLGTWLELAARQLELELEPVASPARDLEAVLRGAAPAVLRLAGGFLLVERQRRGRLRLLSPRGGQIAVPAGEVAARLRAGDPRTASAEARLDTLLQTGPLAARVTHDRPRRRLREALLREQLGSTQLECGWMLRASPAASLGRQLAALKVPARAGLVLATYALQYLLIIVSWSLIGSTALEGRFDAGWLTGWALLILSIIPLRLLGAWQTARISVDVGTALRTRLLAGALATPADQTRRQGAGQLLGRVLECEALEAQSLGAGLLAFFSGLELGLAALVLTAGASAGPLLGLLGIWTLVSLGAGWSYLVRRRQWTAQRLVMTHDVVEGIVGQRTRLVQERQAAWHAGEDQGLASYAEASNQLDRRGSLLLGLIERGWVLLAMAMLAPALTERSSSVALAVAVGGILLARRGFHRLTTGLFELAGARIAWQEARDLLAAASDQEPPADPGLVTRALSSTTGQAHGDPPAGVPALIEARELSFRYRPDGRAVLDGLDLSIRHGDRLLIEGPSGGGKSTLGALLAGLRLPTSGLLLLGGLDPTLWGPDGWRRQVVSAPQFHENHVFGGTLAFNLLMGRSWPPEAADLDEAEQVCRQLGLGPLLERMPSGLAQIVGETGWQLSHGERSRVYLARALLQSAELLVLDESFAALDPETLQGCMATVKERARTLVVIAHP